METTITFKDGAKIVLHPSGREDRYDIGSLKSQLAEIDRQAATLAASRAAVQADIDACKTSMN